MTKCLMNSLLSERGPLCIKDTALSYIALIQGKLGFSVSQKSQPAQTSDGSDPQNRRHHFKQ